MLQIWLEPGLVHLKQSWPQALPTEKQPSTAVVPPKVGSDVPFFLSQMIIAVYCIACCHPTWSRLHHKILRAAFWYFLSQYFLISVWFVSKSGFFFFWPSGWCLPTKSRKITACNASLSGNQSAQPPPRGYSSEGDSGGTLSEGQRMRFCCWGKLFPEPCNMCHISCLNSCHWAEERQQKRFEGMDIEELGSKDTQVGRKFQGAWQLWHCNTVVRVMSQNPEDCTVLPKENPLPSICFVSPLLHKPWNSSDNLEMENRCEQT